MERVIVLNSLMNSKNRLLFRLPIYQKFGNGERNISTVKSYSLVTRQIFYSNQINCRQKSAGPTDPNVLPMKAKPITRDKAHKFQTLHTKVTQLMDSSTPSQLQQSIKLVKRGRLPAVVNSKSTKCTKKEYKIDSQTINMPEVPLLYMPEKFKMKLANNKTLFQKIMKNFVKFLQTNPQNVTKIEEVIKSIQTESDTGLQKDFDPISSKDICIQKSVYQNLKCYINACIHENLNERAYAVLRSIRQNKSIGKRKLHLSDPEVYIDLMANYASIKKWSRVQDIYNILIEDKLLITPQVYMNIFDCLGRMNESSDNTSLIMEFRKKAEETGISLNDIMDKSTFIKDQRTFVLTAIRRIDSSFVPVYTPPQLGYTNKLLDSLNEGIQPIKIQPNELLDPKGDYVISRPRRGFNAKELTEYTCEQIQNECKGYIEVKNITMLDSSKYLTEKVENYRRILEKLKNQWRNDIIQVYKKKLNILQHKMQSTSTKELNIYPYMCLLKPEEYAEILLDELLSLAEGCELYSPTVVSLYGGLGERVMRRYIINVREQNGINEKIRILHKKYREILCSGHCPDNPRQLWQRIIHHSRETGPCLIQKDIDWPWNVRNIVGRTLFKILLEDVKIDANLLDASTHHVDHVPVLYSLFRNRDFVSREEVRPHPVFMRLFRESKQDTMKFETNEVPMLCPPMPWTTSESGGYLQSRTVLLRLPFEYMYQNELVKQTPQEQLYPTLDACNQLGSIPWRVNTKILDLAIEVFNCGGNDKLDVPLTPDNMLTDEHLKYRGMTKNELNEKINLSDEKYQQHQNELLSIYTDTLYKLSLANHFRDRAFWLPTNLDFRGRTYPMSPHLTHLSADLTRSMLCFHQKEPLGESGLDWLKLHCINLTGLKKRNSIQDRLDYANEIIDEILDSADNPLDGRKWWLKSDDPWQTLATCMEIAKAMRSPNPAKFLSGFPIHQDGSCNGLQHYAALGRDVEGAASVNLAPSKVPQDVYSTIANRVEELRQIDAKNGVQVAIDLEGLIKRKIVKQTVMTTVYGVTGYGARLQIKKQLKNIDFPSETIMAASSYLAEKTFDSLSETFKSAREIQDWLTDAARYISSKEKLQHVEWKTPLGLPIIQPYTKEAKFKSNATLHTLSNGRSVNRIKQKNAFSPNFIHSLDSCHMMLTSLNCERAGVTFVSIHDCFWTHPNTVSAMNRICREQFILLHSQPILEDLGEDFYKRYEMEFMEKEQVLNVKRKKGAKTKKIQKENCSVPKHEHIFMKIPEKGEFDINSVLDSIYFFS